MSWFKPEVIGVMLGYACLILLFLLGRKLSRQKTKQTTRKQGKISVLVPFRNEENNLLSLIESIQKLTSLPDEIIFINDHSTDQSKEVLRNLTVPYSLIELRETEGKKSAIAKGVEAAQHEFILTWDADVRVPSDYFERLRQYEWSDLVILPVKMLGPTFVSGFFAMDYQLQTQANVSLSGLYRPISASGANLLFKREVFVEMAKRRKDMTVASGDDQFFLAACRKANKQISVISDRQLLVETTAPNSLVSGMSQRWRWLNKTSKVKDSFATLFGLFALLIQLSYFAFAFYQVALGDWGATIVLILIKGELDAFLATYAFQEQFNTLQVFLYQLFYPVYILALVFGFFLAKPSWKGRVVSN